MSVTEESMDKAYSMDDIQRFIEDRERSKNLQFQRQIEDTERVLKEKDLYYRGLIQRIESKSKAIQDLVKRVKTGYINLCSLMQKEHTKTLQQHKATLSKKFKNFNSDFQKYRLTINKTSCVSMTDVEQQVSDFDVDIPALPHLPDFNFVENTDPTNDVSCAFGALRSGRSKQKHGGLVTYEDASTQTEDNGWILTADVPCSEKPTSSIPKQAAQRDDDDDNSDTLIPTDNQQYETFPKPENNIVSYCLRSVSHFKHPNAFTSLCATVDGAWIAFDRMKKIALVDRNGNIIKTVLAQNSIRNICTSCTTARLWVACSDNRITEYHENGTTGVVLSVSNRPRCLCITPENHVVVGSLEDTLQAYGSISVYDSKGNKMNFIKGRQVRPLQMTSHIRDTTIAVVHGGHSIRHCVTVYNGHLEPKYTFHGTSRSFHPSSLCFHGDGTLFVCDSSCNSILVLDGFGNCQTTMSLESSSKPLLLSIDVNMIWVGYGDSVVKVSQIG